MSNKKLLSEVERTLKKVVEGIAEFDSYLEKLNSSTTTSQKERWEGELKKEIKKLQRLRDQIKIWQLSSEIKDKEPLNESRKSIEVLMEKFKVLEKDLKIKAYSKEGLIAASKIDPKEKEKMDIVNWIVSTVDRLKTQAEAFEAEIEAALLSHKRSGTKRNEKSERQSHLEHLLSRHKYHIDKLELLLRMFENEEVETEQIADIRERVEYYLDSSDSPDFIEDDTVYDDFDFDSKEEDIKSIHSVEDTITSPIEREVDKKASTESINLLSTIAKPDMQVDNTCVSSAGKSSKLPQWTHTAKHKQQSLVTHRNDHGLGVASSQQPFHHSQYTNESQLSSTSGTASITPIVEPIKVWSNMPRSVISADIHRKDEKPSIIYKPDPVAMTSLSQKGLPPSLRSSALENISTHEIEETIQAAVVPETLTKESFFSHFSLFDLENLAFEGRRMGESKLSQDKERIQSIVPTKTILMPKSSSVVDPSVSGSIFNFASQRPSILDQPSFYERLDLDTLFTIFYYLPNTYAQYLAARELKRQSWRFHKKYLTWFQRHEEPKVITEDYEQGTYIYFDYEGSWCQRKKSEFTFEYRFLEDAELV